MSQKLDPLKLSQQDPNWVNKHNYDMFYIGKYTNIYWINTDRLGNPEKWSTRVSIETNDVGEVIIHTGHFI